MIIAIAVAVSVLLPLLFLVLTVPDRPFIDMAMAAKGGQFIETVEKLVSGGNFNRAQRLCAAVDGDIPLVRGVQEMLAKMPTASLADLDRVAESFGDKAEAAVQEREKFSLRRLVRNVACFATPLAFMTYASEGQGWVIGPLTLSFMLTTCFALISGLATASSIGSLRKVRFVLCAFARSRAVETVSAGGGAQVSI